LHDEHITSTFSVGDNSLSFCQTSHNTSLNINIKSSDYVGFSGAGNFNFHDRLQDGGLGGIEGLSEGVFSSKREGHS
jgi:hypothetical protein